jgi:phosphatidylserine decarboxylase
MATIARCLVPTLILCIVIGCFFYWRYVYFFRNPERVIPAGNSIVSPADGTVVYVKAIKAGEDVIAIKKGIVAKLSDIVMEDVLLPKLVVGIFMSPFDVHYNRCPMTSTVESITHHPPRGSNLSMFWMHIRTLFGLEPFYKNSVHILQNERMVTRFSGTFNGLKQNYYVAQIAGMHVRGIDSYVSLGELVDKGRIFGMIRIGSQVDIVLPMLSNMNVKVKPGDVVKAGETVIIE